LNVSLEYFLYELENPLELQSEIEWETLIKNNYHITLFFADKIRETSKEKGITIKKRAQILGCSK
jgi:hypothetical protein